VQQADTCTFRVVGIVGCNPRLHTRLAETRRRTNASVFGKPTYHPYHCRLFSFALQFALALRCSLLWHSVARCIAPLHDSLHRCTIHCTVERFGTPKDTRTASLKYPYQQNADGHRVGLFFCVRLPPRRHERRQCDVKGIGTCAARTRGAWRVPAGGVYRWVK
jgi:hypothetical protein